MAQEFFSLTALEASVVEELSAVRADPAGLAARLKGRLPCYNSKNEYTVPGSAGKRLKPTKEGAAAVRDALAFLQKQPALPRLAASESGLLLAAADHVADRGACGQIGHTGSDGSSAIERQRRYGEVGGRSGECLWFGTEDGATAAQIVEDLVVDDGVPSRGHRLCIFEPAFALAAVRVGAHRTFGSMAAIEFAERYSPDEAAARERARSGPPVAPGAAGTTAHPPSSAGTQWSGQLGTCAGCGGRIEGGAVMEAKGGLGRFHKACFVCAACKAPLAGVPFRAQLGLPRCVPCHAREFGPWCKGCAAPIEGAVLTAGGEVWCSRPCHAKHGHRSPNATGALGGRGSRGGASGRGARGRAAPAPASSSGAAASLAAGAAKAKGPKAPAVARRPGPSGAKSFGVRSLVDEYGEIERMT